jgi:hypothetical protein
VRANLILFFLLLLGACHSDKSIANKNSLKGSIWTSDFFHYHNIYRFTTDSTGFSRDGQYLWSTPVDPASYNNSRDSIAYEEDGSFRYVFKDSVLTLNYASNDPRVFYVQTTKSGYVEFRSAIEYTYGHEYLRTKINE